MTDAPQVSIVIPVYNEAESLPELLSWIDRVCTAHQLSYETILVDDGSQDASWAVIQEQQARYASLRAVRFQRNYGKSAALNIGFQKSRGQVVITLDADLQDSPDEIPELVRMIRTEGMHLVSGWKQKRHDPLGKRLPSRFFNYTTRLITGIQLHDFNCGLKAYDHQVVKSIEVYGEMHRYIPYLAKSAGFGRIGEKVVRHYPRKFGYSKFGFERYLNGFLDLLSVSFMARFGRKPMHFFGVWGTLSMLLGFGITLWLVVQKVLYATGVLGVGFRMRDVVDQPLFYMALALGVIGVQLFLAGFIGELVARSAADRNQYLIRDEIS
ncbi:MAG: glycosyltransferase family 2 protein [Sphingobacteriia bacterium]